LLSACLDRTRVVLLDKETEEAAYIHANYVREPPLSTSYIAALAPELETVDKFVSMIWQENAAKVVMLCRLQEIEWRESHNYYPRKIGQELKIGDISVKCLDIKTLEKGIIVTQLQLTRADQVRLVEHVHLTEWPDFGVTKDVHLVLNLLDHIRPSTGPVIVHCGSGVGRTGTLLAIEIGIQTLLAGQNLSVSDVVKQLRMQRAYAIETDVQYAFVVNSIMTFLHRQNIITQQQLDAFLG
jgi:protein tyrosine phosphatase